MINLCKLVGLFAKKLVVCEVHQMPKFFYAVKVGRKCGLFSSWSECESQVKGFPNPKFKKFATEAEAEAFVKGDVESLPQKRKSSDDSSQRKSKKLKRSLCDGTRDECGNKSSDSSVDVPVVVYTDGCCLNNGKGNARAGLGVYWGRIDHPDNLSERLTGRQTNNRAEIMAVVRALEQATNKEIKNIEIRTDSQFLIKCMTEWMPKWKSRGWLLATGKPVVNKEELEELDAVQKGIQVAYVHVRGHQGEEGNECADRLANEGALK